MLESNEAESSAVDQEDLQENMRYNDRSTSGTAQQISQTAPAAPRINRTAPEPRPQPSQPSQPQNQAPRHQPPRPQRHDDERRQQERRSREADSHPSRRVSDRKPAENPVWQTVNKLTTEKLNESIDKTASALDDLSKSLEESIAKEIPKPQALPPAPKPEIKQAPRPVESAPPPPPPKPTTEPIQQGTLKPGDKIQF